MPEVERLVEVEVGVLTEEGAVVAAQVKPGVRRPALEVTSRVVAHARVHVPVLARDTFLEVLRGRVHLTDVAYRRIEWTLVINYGLGWNIQM